MQHRAIGIIQVAEHRLLPDAQFQAVGKPAVVGRRNGVHVVVIDPGVFHLSIGVADRRIQRQFFGGSYRSREVILFAELIFTAGVTALIRPVVFTGLRNNLQRAIDQCAFGRCYLPAGTVGTGVVRGKTGAAGGTPRIVLTGGGGGFVHTAAQRFLPRIRRQPVGKRLILAEMTAIRSPRTVIFITTVVHIQPDTGNGTAALRGGQQAGKVDLNGIVFIQRRGKHKG